MDTRNGNLYRSVDEARAAGVPEQFLAKAAPSRDLGPRFMQVQNGPCKGRIYEVNEDGSRSRRRKDLEEQAKGLATAEREQLEARAAALADA